jgi:hypothetical protein
MGIGDLIVGHVLRTNIEVVMLVTVMLRDKAAKYPAGIAEEAAFLFVDEDSKAARTRAERAGHVSLEAPSRSGRRRP